MMYLGIWKGKKSITTLHAFSFYITETLWMSIKEQ